jgi:hypothetical protein
MTLKRLIDRGQQECRIDVKGPVHDRQQLRNIKRELPEGLDPPFVDEAMPEHDPEFLG